MKELKRIIFAICSILLLLYLAIPSQKYPIVNNGTYQSDEPADVESPLRRGYYNDETRAGIISEYKSVFNSINILGFNFKLFSFTLNYPPEEAQTLIRDQTRSNYLEEIVHPLRESLFINGFIPQKDSDAIVINGQKYLQKNIVKLVNSNLYLRVIIGFSIILSIYLLNMGWKKYISDLKSVLYK